MCADGASCRKGIRIPVLQCCRVVLFLLCACVVAAADAAGQPLETSDLVGVHASIATSTGVDDNVFNESVTPKKDVVTVFSPQMVGAFQFGRARVSGRGRLDLVRFERYAGERSIDTDDEVRIDLDLNRVGPFVTVGFLNSRQRPRFEIDARARRLEHSVAIGTSVRVTGKTAVELKAMHDGKRFDGDAVFRGTSLSQSMNRDIDAAAAAVRIALTPITTAGVEVLVERERFEQASFRDLSTVRVRSTIQFAPLASIGGQATVGYRQSKAAHPGLDGFAGVTSDVDLEYRVTRHARLSLTADRDLGQSYHLDLPHFVLGVLGGGLEHDLWDGWRVRGRVLRERYEYNTNTRLPSGMEGPARETSTMASLGIRYGTPKRSAVEFTVDRFRRRSTVFADRQIDGLRLNLGMTYGF